MPSLGSITITNILSAFLLESRGAASFDVILVLSFHELHQCRSRDA